MFIFTNIVEFAKFQEGKEFETWSITDMLKSVRTFEKNDYSYIWVTESGDNEIRHKFKEF